MNTQKAARADYVELNWTPLHSDHCHSCGHDPRILFDAEGRYAVGYDATQGLDARGHCEGCATQRQQWRHTRTRES